MTHKLFYALTPNKKLAIDDFLVRSKFDGNRDKFIHNSFSTQAMQITEVLDSGTITNPDGREFKFDSDKAMEVTIPKKSPQYKGEKSVFICGNNLYEDLKKWCKIENYSRSKEKQPLLSFEEWIDGFVNNLATSCIRSNNKAKYDAERNQIESESSVKPKK